MKVILAREAADRNESIRCHPTFCPIPGRGYASAGTSYGPVSVCLSVCLSVYLSQVGVLSKRIDRSSCFSQGSFFEPSYIVLCGKFEYLQNECTFLGNSIPNFGLRKFCHSTSVVGTCTHFPRCPVNITVNVRCH